MQRLKHIRKGNRSFLLALVALAALWTVLAKSGNFLGTLALGLYVWAVGDMWYRALSRFFRWKKDWTLRLMSMGMVVVLVGLPLSMVVVWYKATTGALIGALAVFLGFSYVLLRLARKRGRKQQLWQAPTLERRVLFPAPRLLFWIYVLLWGVTFAYMLGGESSSVLHSPWQAFPSATLPLFFSTMFVCVVFLLSRYKTKTILLVVLLQSMLLHAYLPLSHALPWGGDVWRMIAVESHLSEGNPQYPVLFGDLRHTDQIGEWEVPAVLVRPHKYVYGQLWGISVLLHQSTGIDLVQINRFLIPLLWAILLPLLWYRLARHLFGSPRYGLWMAGLTLVPFSLQALGSLTLATSMGFLTFSIALLFFVSGYERAHFRYALLTYGVSAAMLFGYPLYFFAIWVMLLLSALLKAIAAFGRKVRIVLVSLLAGIAALFFPALELMSGVSWWPKHFDAWTAVKQLGGHASGWFFANQIRPHDILPWNILFNHTPQIAFVENIFTQWRWHLMGFLFLLALFGCYGVVHLIKKERQHQWRVYALLGWVFLVGYIVGWYFLEGDRSFVRRLDPLLAMTLLFAAIYGVSAFFSTWRLALQRKQIRGVLLCLVLGISWSTTTIFASGPDVRSMGMHEYTVAQKLWEERNPPCVLADTWVLLGLEAASQGQLIGGGFPMGAQFAQPERVQLLEQWYLNPATSTLERMDKLSSGKHCDLVLSTERLDPERIPQMDQLFSGERLSENGLMVWKRPQPEQLIE